ncbi:FimV family protein [Undibacterium rugosum]|uniref:Tfp pilus assembly protein FimV n=1 Tax=Undibacterium rugosum TaxID=2762291 RepID=A0A923I2U1_9BURK|nr:hypothetical protein [Undibacterium rugosum]MBC3935335.1 hypothetical protein [Undibacterium rugosum]MBR7779853.1 hypothetical protein [Undibacterium rugosum]
MKAQVELTGADGPSVDMSCIHGSVESTEGVLLSAVNLQLAQRGGNTFLLLQSRKNISEPAIKILLNIQCEVQLHREYLILLDPPQISAAPEGLTDLQGPVSTAKVNTSVVRAQEGVAVSAGKTRTPKRADGGLPDSGSEIVRPQRKAREVAATPAAPLVAKNSAAQSIEKPVKDALKLSDSNELPSQGMKMAQTLSNGAANSKTGAQDIEELRQAQAQFAAMLRGETPARQLLEKVPADSTEKAEKAEKLKIQSLQQETLQLKKQIQLDKSLFDELRENSVSKTWLIILSGGLVLALALAGVLFAYIRRLHKKHAASWWEQKAGKPEPETKKNIEELVDSVQATYTQTGNAEAPESQLLARTVPSAARPVLSSTQDPMLKNTGKLEAHSVFGKNFTPSLEDTNSSTFNFFSTRNHTVKVEEISDVTQEAEFWMSVNDPERAIEILEPQADIDQPDSPVPWLYLLDLYRVVGQKEKYDHLRDRFVVFFNANIPEFEVDPASLPSRTLDDFEHLMKKICTMWNTNEALPFLQSLLVDDRDGKRMGFELPVYRDILLLISIANELERNRTIEAPGHGWDKVVGRSDPATPVLATEDDSNIINFELIDFRKPE